MFKHSIPVTKENFEANGNQYELAVYQVQETGDYDLYISKDGNGVGNKFSASEEIVSDAMADQGKDIVQELIKIAKKDIERNEFNQY
jgi:hypothetical protein